MRATARRTLVLSLFVAAACGGGEPGARPVGNQIAIEAAAEPGARPSLRLDGIVRGDGAVGVVLAHMLGSSQSAWQPLVTRLVDRDFHVLTFDFRGHGLSRGERDPSRADLDLTAAVERLRSLGASKIFVIGASMGGTAALAVAAAQKLEGVVAISAPIEIGDLKVADAARRLDEPSMFMAAEQEDDLYVEAAQQLAARAPEPRRLQIIKGSRAHGTDLLVDTAVSGQVMDLIVDFLVANRG